MTKTSDGPGTAQFKRARTCYDHLAGELGVAVTRALSGRDMLRVAGDRFELTPKGRTYLSERLGVDVEAVLAAKRPLARQCLDWSEREPHLAGALGAALARRCFEAGWVEAADGTRTLQITPSGSIALRREFGFQA